MLKKFVLTTSISICLSLAICNKVKAHETDKLDVSTEGFTIGKSPNHPEREWKVIESEHFIIHYYKGFEKLAKESARLGEEAYFKVTKDLSAVPSNKIPIILTQDEFLNGFAEPVKNRIVLDPILMRSSIIGARRFLTHEFAHIITYEAFNTGFSISKLYALNNVPTWFLEGLAQYEAEYWYPAYDRMLRLHTLERSILTPTERDAFTILGGDEGSAGYNEGYSIVKFIFEKYGHEKLKNTLEEIKANNIPLSLAFERVVGKSLFTLEAEWRQSIEENYQEQIKKRENYPKESEVIIKKDITEANIKPKVAPNGKIFTYMTSKGRGGYVNIRGKIIGLMPIRAAILGNTKNSDIKVAGEKVDKSVFTEKDSKGTLLTGGVIDYSWSSTGDMIAYTHIAGDDLGQPDIVLGFKNIKIQKEKIEAKEIYEYNYEIYEEEDKNFKNPMRLISSPIFEPNGKKLAFIATVNEKNNVYEIELRDLLKKKTKIIAKALTKTSDYFYKDLSWSPNGKYIVASIFKPGDGGNLVLLDIKEEKSFFITNDSVIYANTDPYWSEDSKNIYFSSDRDDISNIYSFNLEEKNIYKLTNSYRGFEFPSVKDNYLYFTSHFAKGTEIRRVSLEKLNKELVESNITLKEVTETVMANQTKLTPKDYFPGLSPDIIIPLTGVDERGDQIGARFSFSDMLGKHSINAALAYGLISSKVNYGLGYVNRMFDPLMGFQISEFPGIAATQDGKGYYFQREQSLNLVIARPFFNELADQISNIGSAELTFSNLKPIEESISKDVDRKLVRSGLNNFLTLSWRSQEVLGGSTADIHPLNGYLVDLRVEHATKLLGSKYEYTQVLGDFRKYLPLWFNHVLFFNSSLQVSAGDTTPLLLGGPPVNLNIGIQQFTPMRGFNIADFIGNRLYMLNSEYRFPIMTRMNTLFSGIYLDGIYGAFFADMGDAWFAEKRNPQFNLGLGAELRFRVAVGGRNTLGAYVGLGRKFIYNKKDDGSEIELPDNKIYFGFANSF